MIIASDLTKRFGAVRALDGATFSAQDGQITGILGPNGAGKTTLLRIVYGLLQPDSGGVTLGGVDVGLNPVAAKKQMGVFPDRLGTYERLSTREVIHHFASHHGLDAKQRTAAIDRLVDELDLSGIIDRRTKGFSQG